MWPQIRELLGLMPGRQRWMALLLVGLLVLNALLEVATVSLVPIYVTILVDPQQIIGNGRASRVFEIVGLSEDKLTPGFLLYGASAVLLLAVSIKVMFVPLLTYYRSSYVKEVVESLSAELFRKYMRAPYEFHLSRNSSELIRNVSSECVQIGWKVLDPLIDMAASGLVVLAMIAVMVVSIPGSALLVLVVFLGVSLLLIALLQKQIKRLSTGALQGREMVLRSVQEGIAGIKEIRLLRQEGSFVRRFEAALKQVLSQQRFSQVVQKAIPTLLEWVSVVAMLIMALMLFRTHGEQLSVASKAALFGIAMIRMRGAVSTLLNQYTELRSWLLSVSVVGRDLRQLHQAQSTPPAVASANGVLPLGVKSGIHIHDVWFRYSGRPDLDYALKGIELHIDRGEAVGFVGPSGAGKSTLLDVVLGILAPERGAIYVDGVATQCSLESWHRTVGYVPQAIFLVDGSVRQNIALGVEEAEIDGEAMNRAISAANLSSLLEQLPRGIHTRIGERGVRLSGGQRQRIAIARALYHNPEVLVMDEATSALDNVTEREVMQAVDELKGHRTLLIIAHRLSTVRNCDRIVFLKEGQVLGVGSYSELIATNDDFNRMVDAAS